MKRLLAGAIALVALTSSQATAQVPGVGLNLFPRIGVFQPKGNLVEIPGTTLKLGSGLAIGLSAELALPLLPDLRGNLEYVPGVKLKNNERDTSGNDNSMLALTGDLVINLSPPLSPVKPYALLGGGVKRYEFDSTINSTNKESSLTLHAGAGVGVKLGPLSLVGEASDYISWFKLDGSEDGKMQNDIFFMVGFKIGMF